MKRLLYNLSYQLLLFIWLILFGQCGCGNTHKPNKEAVKPDPKTTSTTARTKPENNKPNQKQSAPSNANSDNDLPLSDFSEADIRALEAISGNKAEFLVKMLRALKADPKRVNMDSRDDKQDGGTVLHAAVKYGLMAKPNLIKDLVKLGADVNAQDNNGKTSLHTAVQEESINGIRSLLEQGASLVIPDNNGYTPLHGAVKRLNPEVIQALLEKATYGQRNILDANGYTPLHIAVFQGNLAAVLALLQRGEDFNIFTPDGKNALHLAAVRGHFEIFKALVEAGTDINVKTQDNKTARELTQDKDIIAFIDGVVPVSVKVDEVVINAIINGLLEEGKYPFLVQKLFALAHDPNPDINDLDPANGTTALQQAVELGDLKLIKILLDHGADINVTTSPQGATPLYLAAEKGNLAVVEYLLTKNAGVNISDSSGITPLYIATANGYRQIVNSLIEHGANVNLAMNTGVTPLYVAVINGYEEIVNRLLEKGAMVQQAYIDKAPTEEIRFALEAYRVEAI